jgi:hypothetical protein
MYFITSDVKASLLAGGAASVGMLQTMYLRSNPGMLPAINQLGRFGQPAVFYNVALGGVALGLGLMGKMKGKYITSDLYQNMAIAYGMTALVGGAWNYFFPGVTSYMAPVVATSTPVAQAFAVNEPVAAAWIMRQLDTGIL